MKFISWNVNGLRACCDKGFRDAFNQLNADFFCLQETKMSTDMPLIGTMPRRKAIRVQLFSHATLPFRSAMAWG